MIEFELQINSAQDLEGKEAAKDCYTMKTTNNNNNEDEEKENER